ncbi:MAG: tetratricopeptide repeat protein [Nannocystaceae bacterium]|nr:tetratricopeptide repeat protein [Nannocystaceae bacterium]
MADARTALLDHLRVDDATTREALAAAVANKDAAAARVAVKDEPASGVAAATLLARLLLDGLDDAELIETAKGVAARAPRDDAGNDVALLAGAVVWRRSGQAQLAEPYFRRVRRSEPAHPEVLAFYRALFAGDAGVAQLISVLVQARRASKDAEARFALAEEVAKLAESQPGGIDRAIETWRSVLREDGYDARAAAALERLYRDSGKWTALVELLKEESDRLGDGEAQAQARIARLLEIAALYRDRLKLDTMALATLQRILDVDPWHEASLEALAETYAKAGRNNDLLGVYQRRIAAARDAGDVPRQVELLRKVAEIWLEQLGNPQRALEPLQSLLQLSPRDVAARTLLARIHEQRRDFRALIALRRQELSEREGDDARTLRLELAQLAEEKLGDRREAIAAYGEVLVHHGDDATALAGLLRLYERESRWADAAEILHRQLRAADAATAPVLLAQLGSLYSDRLASRADAVPVWSELLRLEPGHERALRRLREAFVAEAQWDRLHALYEQQGRLADLVEVLQSAADRLADTDARVALYRRVAKLCQGPLGQPERALRALERTLAIQPHNTEVARELVPIYKEQRNWARLLSTYEVLLGAATDDDERLALIESLRSIAEEKLASPTLTLQWAAEAYRLRPTQLALRTGLEAAAERADGWDELSRIFEQRIADAAVADEERLVLLDKLAAIARDKLSKPDDAQRYYRRIIALDPNNAAAMTALESIYTATRRWDDLAEVYRRRLEVESQGEAKLETLRQLAKLHEEQLGDLDAAVATYRSILEHRHDDAVALDSLARIHRNRGQWAELADVLERKLAREGQARARVPLVFELADIHATRLADPARATAGFLAVLELDGEHRAAVEALERLRTADPTSALAIMRGLLPYYRRVEDRPREAEAMEVIVAAESDPAQRHAQLEQLAAIYEKMDERRADALRIRGELFRIDPRDWDARKLLQRLGGELGRVPDVADAYADVLAGLAREADEAEAEGRTLPRERAVLRRDLLLEHAAMLRDKLGRAAEAEAAYAEVLEADETHQGAYEALETLLRARGAHAELRALYRRRADVSLHPREQRELLSRIIELSRTKLDDRATAIASAEELLDLIPDDVSTLELLAGMYEQSHEHGDRVKLEEAFGRWAELERDPTRARALQVRRATLRMQELGDAFGAVDLLGQVLGSDPDHERARGLLEELLGVAEVQLQAAALLEPVYQRRRDHAGRIRVLSVRREAAEGVGALDQAITQLVEIARIREHDLGDQGGAFATLREAYAMDVRRADTRNEVERLGLALSRPAELAETWRQALAQAGNDRALKLDLTRRLAELAEGRLRDGEAARRAWTELLALDPPDVALAQRAVESLCRLHLEAGDGPALVEAKRALLRFAADTDTHVRVRLEIAEIQEQLGDRVGAALTYSEVLDLQPGNLPALDALERLFLEEQEWQRLCEVLEHRVGVTTDPRGRAAIFRQIGEIQRDQLQDPHRALWAFQSILDAKPGREDTIFALSALVALNERLERWADVDDGLRRLIALADSDPIRVELLTRTALVVGRRLGRGGDALDLLKRVLDLSPTHAAARAEVARYLDGDDTRERAIRILLPLFEAEQNWPELLALEELQARKQPSGRRRLAALLRVAKTQQERIGDPDRAFAVLCEAMAEAADQPELSEILGKVEALGAEAARAQGLLDAYAATVDHILEAELQQRVLRAMGQVALDRLGRLDEARTAYERVLALAPGDLTAADALERIYLQLNEHEALANLLSARADRTADAALRDRFLVRAADLVRRQLERPDDAIRLYERLSAEALQRPEVQAALEPLYEATGRWRELAAHLGRKLAGQAGTAAVDTHLRLGRLLGEKLDDPEGGIRHLSTALRLDPEHARATEELGRYLEDPSMRARVAELLEPVFAAVADWPRLIQVQEIRLAEANDDTARSKLLLRIAQIEEEQLEDLDRAFESYTRLFREQPSNRYVRDQLSRLAGVLAATERYAELLTQHADDTATDDSDDNLAIVREAADLWSGTLRKPARAVPLLTRMLAARPEQTQYFAQLEVALTQAESWRELADAYWREVDRSPSEDRQIELLRKLATLAQELLDDPAEAARAYQRMLEIRPDFELARGRVEQILGDTGRHAELLDALRDRIARSVDAEDRNRVALRIAQLQDGPLQDPDGAVDTLENMLAEIPDDRDAVVMLERIAQVRSEMRPRVLATLRPIYERAGNTRRLVEIDEWQLAHTSDPHARHELYFEIATLQLRVQDTHDAALGALLRALAEPGPAELLTRLDAEVRRVAELLEQQPRLADALVAAAGAQALAGDDERRVELLVWAARVRQAHGEMPAAAEHLRAALAIDPDHVDALALLDVALMRQGEHEELAAVLDRRAMLANDDRERVSLLRRRAVLLGDTLDQADAALETWVRLLELEPADREALAALARAYERRGEVAELIDVIERQIDASDPGVERRALRLRLAQLQRDRGERSAEIDALQTLLGETGDDVEALALLGDALLAESRHGEAAVVLERRAELARTEAERAALLLDVARLQAGPIGDLPAALAAYERVFALLPASQGALADVTAMARTEANHEAAALIVIPRLEAAGRWPELAEVWAARTGFVHDDAEKATALRALAKLRLERLEDPRGALAATVALLDVVDDDALPDVLDRGGRLAVQLGAGSEHVELLQAKAAEIDRSPATRVAMALYAAQLCEEILGEAGRALTLLLPVVDEGLATPAVCSRAERLARSAHDGEALQRVLREAARLATGDGERADALVKLGRVQLELGLRRDALDAFHDAFELQHDAAALAGLVALFESTDAPEPALLDALEGAYQSTGDTAGVTRVVEARLGAAQGSERTRLLEQAASAYEDANQPAKALTAWGELLAADPESVAVAERVFALAKGGLASQGGALLLRAVRGARGHVPVQLALQTASFHQRELGEPAVALALCDEVAAIEPERAELVELGLAAARAAGRADALHRWLVRGAELEADPVRQAALWGEAAGVAEQQLHDPALALTALQHQIDADENDGRAWNRLLTLLATLDDAKALVDALGRRIMLASDPEERRALRRRLARVHLDRLDATDDAVAVLEEAIADQPDDREAIDELDALLTRLGRWTDVRDNLERKLVAASGGERVAVLEQLARLAEDRLGDPIDAIERLQQLLTEEPGHAAAQAALERLLIKEERFAELAQLLEDRMETARAAGDVDAYRGTASALAELLAEKLGDPERAQEILANLLELDPTYVPGILALAAVYEARGDEGAMRITLQRAVDQQPRGAAGAQLHLRLARLAGEGEGRREHLRLALELDPDNRGVADELLALARREQRWDEVSELLARLEQAEHDDGRRRALALERIDLLLDKLDLPEAALKGLAPIYQQVQDDPEINRRIAAALFSAKRFDEAEGMYNWLVEVGRRGKRTKAIAQHLTRLAQISLRRENRERARELLLEAYRVDTTNVETLMTLGALHESSQEWKDALKIWRTMLLQNADQSGLLRRGDIYIGLARAHVNLQEKPKAKAMLRRGLEEDVGHPELGRELAALED